MIIYSQYFNQVVKQFKTNNMEVVQGWFELILSRIQLFPNNIIYKLKQSKMKKGTYHPKIARKKIPNLLHMSQKQVSSKTQWPTFFSKIQNSLKLLEEPIKFEKPKEYKNKYLSYRQTISLRLKQLSKPKQRRTNLTQIQLNNKNKNQDYLFENHNQYTNPIEKGLSSHNDQRFYSPHKPVSLPLMYPPSAKSKNYYSIEHKMKSQNLSRGGDSNKTEKGIQQIAATTLIEKSFDDILAIQKQQIYKQFDEYLQKENSEDTIPTLKIQAVQENVSKNRRKNKSSSHKSPKERESDVNKEQEDINNLTQLSGMLIREESKEYETYDKKLMEKVKLYRSKKPIKFNHQVMWK